MLTPFGLEYLRTISFIVTIAAIVLAHSAASAQDTLKISVGARGAFDNQVSEVGQQQGFFKKHGLNLEIVYTQGSGEYALTIEGP